MIILRTWSTIDKFLSSKTSVQSIQWSSPLGWLPNLRIGDYQGWSLFFGQLKWTIKWPHYLIYTLSWWVHELGMFLRAVRQCKLTVQANCRAHCETNYGFDGGVTREIKVGPHQVSSLKPILAFNSFIQSIKKNWPSIQWFRLPNLGIGDY